MKKRLIFLAALCCVLCGTVNAQIFYKVEGNGLESPSFIFGTHHLAPLSVVDSIPGCWEAFRNAEQVVGEIDLTADQASLAMKMQPFMMAPQDSTLSKVIAPEDLARVNEEFKKWAPMPGMELSMLDMMKPMVVTSMVSVQMVMKNLPGFNPAEQLDTYFMFQGKNTGKTVRSLETPEFQAELLYGFEPISSQAAHLVELLDDPDKMVDQSKRMNQAYLSQNIETLYEMMNEEKDESALFAEKLINMRNANWIKELPAIFAERPTFVAVGALHLPGEHGVLEGLRKAGYTITPIMKK